MRNFYLQIKAKCGGGKKGERERQWTCTLFLHQNFRGKIFGLRAKAEITHDFVLPIIC